MIRCPDCPVRTKAAFRQFSADELAWVTRAKIGERAFQARAQIVRTGDDEAAMFTILSGWAFRYKALSPAIRQILDFLLPGDQIGLQSPLTGKVRHDVAAVTPVTLCRIAGQPVRNVFEEQPDLAAALVQTLLLDEDRADRRLLLLGRQRPTQRLAYLMLELHDRLRLRGLAQDGRCAFPLTYGHLADALGLSRAQLARSLAELRDRGWAQLSSGQLVLQASSEMAEFAAYDPTTPTEPRALI